MSFKMQTGRRDLLRGLAASAVFGGSLPLLHASNIFGAPARAAAPSGVNRQWIYAKPVTDKLSADNFTRRESPIPVPGRGQTLVRNRLVSIDPSNRGFLTGDGYRRQVQIGEPMAAFGIGEVLVAGDRRFKVGDIIHCDTGWQDYAIVNTYDRQEWVYRCTPGYSDEDLLGVLGLTGLTAYFGMRESGPLKAGETVVVGGATGACGTLIGQLAKNAGCRVVGFAGGPDKAKWLVEELGFDAAVDYRGRNVAADLKSKCPKGVDLFSDAIGGQITDVTFPLLNQNSRWFDFGDITTYDQSREARDAQRAGLSNLGLTAAQQKIYDDRKVRLIGLLVWDYYGERLKGEADLARLMKEGKLKAPTTVLEGFEHLPAGLLGTFAGANNTRVGKVSVRVA